MSTLTKELLQRIEDSVFREAAIKQDAKSHFFYLSVLNGGAPADPIGTRQEVNVQHVSDRIESNANHMVTISISDSTVIQSSALSLPIYIRFPGLEPATRYHFVVTQGVNSFNSNNAITIPCSKFPSKRLLIEFGYTEWNNLVTEQTEQSLLADVNPLMEVVLLNVRFKIQTTTLE